MKNDPLLTLVAGFIIASLVIIALLVGAIVVIPGAILFGIGYLIYKHFQPKPQTTLSLSSHTQAHVNAARFPQYTDFLESHMLRFLESCKDGFPPQELYLRMIDFAGALYESEDLYNPLPPLPTFNDPIQEGRYRDALIRRKKKLQNPEKTLSLIHHAIGETLVTLMQSLPPAARLSNEQFFSDDTLSDASIPLVDLIDVPATVQSVVGLYLSKAIEEAELFQTLRAQLKANLTSASGDKANKWTLPTEFDGTPEEAVQVFLKHTPLLPLFFAAAPFVVPAAARMEHTLILGGSGAGKTTLLQHQFLKDIRTDAPMVIIDPKGEMVRRLERLPIHDRLVVIDPNDTPALNMFHAADRWNRTYDDNFRQQLEAQAIGNFAYIFSSIESPLTQKQTVCFTFCIRAMFRTPNANITTLMELLDDPAKAVSQSKFGSVIERLDPTSRQFFRSDYYSSNFGETRQQIKARLYGMLVHPQLLAMFSTPQRKIDIFDCLQSHKIVLVNGALGSPGSEASQLFCRYFVALTLNAAFERAAIPKREWHPAHLIIDEFQLVADEVKTPEMLRLAREYNLGITMAFQELHGRPFNDNLRTSISTNTSVKYASSPEGVDITYVARDLRAEPEFIRAQTKTSTHAKFGCFVRGFLDRPVSISVPFGGIEREAQVTEPSLRAFRDSNRQRLTSASPSGVPTPPLVLDESNESEPPTSKPAAPRDAGEPADSW